MKKLCNFFFLVVVFSVYLPWVSTSAPKICLDDSICSDADYLPVAYYYVNQTNERHAYFENMKIEEKLDVFEKAVDFAFSVIQKRFLPVFYQPYLSACSRRWINLSKFKKLTIYSQTIL